MERLPSATTFDALDRMHPGTITSTSLTAIFPVQGEADAKLPLKDETGTGEVWIGPTDSQEGKEAFYRSLYNNLTIKNDDAVALLGPCALMCKAAHAKVRFSPEGLVSCSACAVERGGPPSPVP
jgi:hypothetical protein